MSDFGYSDSDYLDSDSFLLKTGNEQTNKTVDGKEVPLKTTASESPPKTTMGITGLSDAMMNSSLLKPVGAQADIYNRVGQDAVATVIGENGGPQAVLGGSLAISPTDLILKAENATINSGGLTDAVTGSGYLATSGSFPPPAPGEYRSNNDMRSIYGINSPNKTPPHGGAQEGLIVSFTWWTGVTYSVHKATLPVWQLVDSILKKYNYPVRKSETGGGGYNRRKITGGSDWSLHAYGIAVDINPSVNPYGPTLITDMPEAMVNEILEIRTVDGSRCLRWGGTYRRNKDAMHYEVMVMPSEIAKGVTIGGQASGSVSTHRMTGYPQ